MSEKDQVVSVPDEAATVALGERSGKSAAQNTPSMGRTTVFARAAVKAVNDPRQPAIGRDRYEPVRALGQGGMGEVSLVRDRDIERWVAIKRLKPESDAPEAMARFVEEIQTTGQLEHPNIVPIHDVGTDAAGRYYFVMKYADGETLSSVIEKLKQGDQQYHTRFTLAARALVFRELLRAVDHAHRHGIIHRDIKPANVVIGLNGEVMLMDWGIAKRIRAAAPDPNAPPIPALDAILNQVTSAEPHEGERRAHTHHGAILGTPAYMSPEQARGDPVDERSDVYSLGATWYELISLYPYLSPKGSLKELLRGVAEEIPINPRAVIQKNPGVVPHAFCVIALKALAKDPKDRFQTVGDLLQSLDAAIEGRPACYWECPPAVTDHTLGQIRKALWSQAGDVVNILLWFVAALAVYGAVRLATQPDRRQFFGMGAIAGALLLWTFLGNVRPSIVNLIRNQRRGFAAQPNILGMGKKPAHKK